MKSLFAFALAAVVLAGCASYSGSSLLPGAATQAEVRRLMGEPAAIHKGDKGGQSSEFWEYPRGPAGRQTFMARFDGSGKLTAIDQVLTIAQTANIAWGQASRDDVRKVLGRPGAVSPRANGGEMWDYAALAEGQPRKIRIVVLFDSAGRAVSGGEALDLEELSPASDSTN